MMQNESKKTTKELILDTAFSFLENPYFSSFSMNELAAKVGISKPAIYRHFKNKDALLEAMEDKIVDGMAVLLKDIGSKDLEITKKSLSNLIQYFIENPSHINYYIVQMSQNINYEERILNKLCERQVECFLQNQNAYITDFKSDMNLFAKHIFSGMSLFYFVKLQQNLCSTGKLRKLPEDFALNVVNLLLNGLSGSTEKDSPVYPVSISEERRNEIISLCKISDDSFPNENKIFTALASVIEKYKISGVTVDRIASELNMAKSSLYEYFDNKNQMIKCLITKELSLLNMIINENTIEAKNFTEYILIQMYSELEYFMHRPSIIPICGWLLMSNSSLKADLKDLESNSADCKDDINYWEKQLPDRIISPNLGFPYSPRLIMTWAGVLPVAFLVEAKGKNLSDEKFMEGFTSIIEYFFNGIK